MDILGLKELSKYLRTILYILFFAVCYFLLNTKNENNIKISEKKEAKSSSDDSSNKNSSKKETTEISKRKKILKYRILALGRFLKYFKAKRNINIHGFHIMMYSEENNKFYLSNLLHNANKLSKEMYNYYKLKQTSLNFKNKNKELSLMFIESLASLNCDKMNNIEIMLFNMSNWKLINHEDLYYEQNKDKIEEDDDEEEFIISKYIRYKDEDLLENKIQQMLNVNDELYYILNEEENENKIIRKHYELGIVRNFDNDINNHKNTNIIKDINDKYYKVYSQGYLSNIKNLCLNSTIPENLNELANDYISQNKTVIALSGKLIKMNYFQSQKIERRNCEKNMIFLGLIILDKND